MRKYIEVLSVIIMCLVMMSTTAVAAPRVICDVTIIADNSAKVSLMWSDSSVTTGIMITSWDLIEENGESYLAVYYKTGQNVPEGFSEREITHETYHYPMKVRLEPSTDGVSLFNDITASKASYDEIMNLYHRGIISGYPDGSFRADKNVTRGEFSKMLILSAKYDLDDQLTSSFSDVRDSLWSRKYIMTLASKGIVNGKGNNQFDPNGHITIGEVLKVLSLTFDLYSEGSEYPYALGSHWSNAYFIDVVSEGLVISSDAYYKPYTPNAKATREDCAVLLSRVLENLHDVAK